MRTNLILMLLATVLAVPTTWTYLAVDRNFTDYAEVPRLLAGFHTENVYAFRVSVPKLDPDGELLRVDGEVVTEVLEAQRDPQTDDWYLMNTEFKGARLRADRIRTSILEPLEMIRLDEKALIVADCPPEQLAEYGLDEDSAIKIECFDREIYSQSNPSAVRSSFMARLYKGKDASEGKTGEDVVQGFFVRLADSHDVVLFEKPYWQVSASTYELLDRNPMKFNPEAAVELQLSNDHGDLHLKKAKPNSLDWEVVKCEGPAILPEDVGAPKLAEIIGLLQTVTFTQVKFIDPWPAAGPDLAPKLAEWGLDDPEITVSVVLSDGREFIVSIGAKIPGANDHYLHISGVPFLLAIGDWAMSSFNKRFQTYLDPSAAALLPKQDDKKDDKQGEPESAGGAENTGGAQKPGAGTEPETGPKPPDGEADTKPTEKPAADSAGSDAAKPAAEKASGGAAAKPGDPNTEAEKKTEAEKQAEADKKKAEADKKKTGKGG